MSDKSVEQLFAALILLGSISIAFLTVIWFIFWGAGMLIAHDPFWGWLIVGMSGFYVWGAAIFWAIKVAKES